MELRKQGVSIACQQCKLAAAMQDATFEIVVPIRCSADGASGEARVRGSFGPDGHAFELIEWTDNGDAPRTAESDAAHRARINAALDELARKAVCGNQNLCPSDVVIAVQSIKKQHAA